MRRKSKKESDMKVSAATTMVLGGLFVVLNFIYAHNFEFVDDYRYFLSVLLFFCVILCETFGFRASTLLVGGRKAISLSPF